MFLFIDRTIKQASLFKEKTRDWKVRHTLQISYDNVFQCLSPGFRRNCSALHMPGCWKFIRERCLVAAFKTQKISRSTKTIIIVNSTKIYNTILFFQMSFVCCYFITTKQIFQGELSFSLLISLVDFCRFNFQNNCLIGNRRQ